MKLQSGLVTIAIPAYKSQWLSKAIASALNQEYDNIELIIVDDHSPFVLRNIVEPFLSDRRVSYYYNNTNLGKKSIVYNWNKCVDLAHGEFFVLLCDDDVLYPNFVISLLALAAKYPTCNVFHGHRAIVDDATGEIEEEKPWPEYESFESFSNAEYSGKRHHTITEFLYRTDFLKEEKFEVFPVGYFSDNATILRLTKVGGIASTQSTVCQFRKSAEHITNNKKFEVGKAKAAIQYFKWYKNHINTSLSDQDINGRLDIWLHKFFKNADNFSRLRIILLVPHSIWGFKKKIYMLLLICMGKSSI